MAAVMMLSISKKSLAVTMRNILDELPFDRAGRINVDAHFTSSLNEAIRLYTRSRKDALDLLYKNKQLTQSGPIEKEADFEEVAASCGYFSFSLLDFANEMKIYLEALDELKLEVEERPEGRTWTWLAFWRHLFRLEHSGDDLGT